jgi:hypothetical protein
LCLILSCFGEIKALLGNTVKLLSSVDLQILREPRIWVLVFGLFTYLFAKGHLCKCFQLWLWLEVGLRSQELIFVRTLMKVFDLPEEHDRRAIGGFLSDFNKGGSLDACLEEVIFAWFHITFDLLTTSADLWMRLGIMYGLSAAMISPVVNLLYYAQRPARALEARGDQERAK